MEPQIRFCTSADGTRIAYATLGEGPPLVRFPAWGADMEQDWELPEGRGFFESLAEGRLLIWFDRRGVGASQREVDDLSPEAHVADFAAVLSNLQLERFHLFSDGGPLGATYAAQHPERVSRLVLWGPYAGAAGRAKPEYIRGLVDLIRGNWSVARRAIADVFFPNGPIDALRWFSSSLRQHMSPEVAVKYVELQASLDLGAFLPQVKAPTLVLHRRGSRAVPIAAGRAVAALIPDARFIALEGSIAIPYFDHAQYLALVKEFLDEGRAQEPADQPPEPGAFRTILFTDVEGSTSLTQRLGDAKAREVLRTHERIVREALRSHGGAEVKTMGDGFMASFPSASRALECAITLQRAFAAHNESAAEPIQVRIGLNAGEPIAEEKDLFGTAVILAARVAAQASGGEILASEAVRQIVAGKGFVFSDRGDAALRGFEDPVRLYEVSWREDG